MLRIVLLMASAFSAVWIIIRIRRSKVQLQDTLFWIGMAVILMILGLFPEVSYRISKMLGFNSPSNFIFLIMICLLFEKMLTLSIIHSQLEDKFITMASEMALRCKDLEQQVKQLKAGQETESDAESN